MTTFACATGLSLAAVTGPRPVIAIAGLTISLASCLGGLLASFRSSVARTGPSSVVVAAIVLTGLSAAYLGGCVRVMSLDQSDLRALIGDRVRAELVVTGQVRANCGWQSAGVRVTRLHSASTDGNRSFPDSATLDETALLEVPPLEDSCRVALVEGQTLVVEGTVEEPEGVSASGFDQRAHLRHQGIQVVIRADRDGVDVTGRREGICGWFDELRLRARDHLSRGPDDKLDELMQGVVMGDTAGIDGGWLEAFRRSGTAHMFSVSGLHVASLAAIMIGLAGLMRAPRGVGFALGAAAALLMIPFAGASPPVLRAAVMIVMVLAGRWVGRRRDQWQVLALAAAVVLAINPYALFDVGFQLSFSAFGGMLALVGPLERMLRRLPRSIGSNLAVSVAASLGTAPVSLAVFGRTSLVGALANILVVPLLPVVMGLGMASVMLGFLWTGLSAALDFLVAPAAAWTVQVSRLFGMAPVMDASDVGRGLLAVTTAIASLPAGLALMGRAVRSPLGIPLPFFRRGISLLRLRRPRSPRRGAALAAVIVLSALTLGTAMYPLCARVVAYGAILICRERWPAHVEVRMLDVGQGNAVLVRTPEHHALLFDAGPEGCHLSEQLATLGVHRLDLVVISHPHADHFAGLLESVGSVEVGIIVDGVKVDTGAEPVAPGDEVGSTDSRGSKYSSGGGEARDYLELRKRLREEGSGYAMVGNGSSINLDGLSIRFFGPQRPLIMLDAADPWSERGGPPTGDELNAASLVALLRWGDAEVLLPGDAEAEALERYELPPIDIMIVPHHGSRDAVSAKLLSGLGAKAAGISVGRVNSFGHPDAVTLSLLEQAVGNVRRTDNCGWVSYTIDGVNLRVTTER